MIPVLLQRQTVFGTPLEQLPRHTERCFARCVRSLRVRRHRRVEKKVGVEPERADDPVCDEFDLRGRIL